MLLHAGDPPQQGVFRQGLDDNHSGARSISYNLDPSAGRRPLVQNRPFVDHAEPGTMHMLAPNTICKSQHWTLIGQLYNHTCHYAIPIMIGKSHQIPRPPPALADTRAISPSSQNPPHATPATPDPAPHHVGGGYRRGHSLHHPLILDNRPRLTGRER